MQQQIEYALQPLIGQPLLYAGRADSLMWFHFGRRRTVPIRDGKTKEVGDYALHIQCTWRLRDPNHIIVASVDRYFPADEEIQEGDEPFDWDRADVNRGDKRMSDFLAAYTNTPLVVTDTKADNLGGIQLTLGNIYTLDVFPDNSLPGEYWRLFHPGESYGNPHFIVTGTGLDS